MADFFSRQQQEEAASEHLQRQNALLREMFDLTPINRVYDPAVFEPALESHDESVSELESLLSAPVSLYQMLQQSASDAIRPALPSMNGFTERAPQDSNMAREAQAFEQRQSDMLANMLPSLLSGLSGMVTPSADEGNSFLSAKVGDAGPLAAPVEPGVSKGEMSKAATKFMEEEAKSQSIATMIEMQKGEEARQLRERIEQLQAASSPGTEVFVGDGKDVTRSDASAMKGSPRKGSFSKTDFKPGQPMSTIELMKRAAVRGGPMAQYALQQLGRLAEVEAGKETSSEEVAIAPTGKFTSEQEDMAILNLALSSKDPMVIRPILIAMLRRKGRSDAYIDALLKQIPREEVAS